MPSPEPISRQVRTEQIWNLLRQLARRLWSKGLDHDQLREAWRSNVEASCGVCGTRLTGDELAAALDLLEGDVPPGARLQRLAQGYCPKPGCDSRYYRLTLRPAEGIEWETLITEADLPPESDSEGANEEAQPKKPRKPKTTSSRTTKIRIVLALVFLGLAILIRQWYLHGRLPFVNQTFQVAPAETNSTAPNSFEVGSPQSPTNGVFRVAE